VRFKKWWQWVFDERNIVIPAWFMGWCACEMAFTIGVEWNNFCLSAVLFVCNYYFYKKAKNLLSEDNKALHT
jgi:hypothetical protein